MSKLLLLFVVFVVFSSISFAQTRLEIPLDQNWQIRKQGEQEWQNTKVPGNFESQIDVEFDTVAEYRIQLPDVELKTGERLVVHFDAVATETTVLVNDTELGKHLGGWTPFRFDITEQYKSSATAIDHLIVRVDEKVGHNTQGFLPIIAPHFGGDLATCQAVGVARFFNR